MGNNEEKPAIEVSAEATTSFTNANEASAQLPAQTQNEGFEMQEKRYWTESPAIVGLECSK